ncbi:MAG: N-acetylgalactosamine 6-sulfate sulfatase [Planctomycetota bacterium]|nr:MAG: N-acetylgalactosamine 6-sulfate sulfatase [Planctomycetota bacterium]
MNDRLRFAFLCLLIPMVSQVFGVEFETRQESLKKPNVLVILTDDQGWGDLSIHGNLNLSTPHIDSIARNGASFDRFYVSPVCSPTRAEFLTGRYHGRSGVRNVSMGGERMNLDEITIANHFKSAGYRTSAIGKWHNGSQFPYHPTGRGFDDFYGYTSGHWGDYFSPPLENNGLIVQGNGFLADDITDHTLSFLDQNRANPFFCYVTFNTPHSPMQVPDPYWNRFKDRELKSKYHGTEKEDENFTRAALAMVENIDDNIGRILDKLNSLKIENETIVVFFCDNGPNAFRFNGGMKGRKATTDEGGVRSPLFIRWPGSIQSEKSVKRISAAFDLLPTLTDLAGIKRLQGKPLDGVSFAKFLTGHSSEPDNRMIFSHWAGKVSVRTQTHRLDDQNRLFDMIKDPGQTSDISKNQPSLHAELKSAVKSWRIDALEGIRLKDNRPFPIGYSQFLITHLPARDALFSGEVKRSALAPNCSFLTNWKADSDTIYWPVQIETTGTYELVFHHTIAAPNIGCRINLSFNDRLLTSFKLDQVFDPPLRGIEHDRVPRNSESLVKDFLPLSVPNLKLTKGQGILKLQASDIKAGKSADLRGISLILKSTDR